MALYKKYFVNTLGVPGNNLYFDPFRSREAGAIAPASKRPMLSCVRHSLSLQHSSTMEGTYV